MGRARGIKNNITLEERFWDKVVIDDNTGCWNTKVTTVNPAFYLWDGKKKNIRYVSWWIVHGSFPEGILENKCGNLKCVNPDHYILFSSWQERFLTYVDIKSDDVCWEWLAHKDSKGYGIFNNEISTKAHRLSWVIHNGDIPNDLFVCHKCDNPSCVNPNHLFLGTAKDNNLDKISKGRGSGALGERNFGAILSEKQVIAIRFLYSSGKFSTYFLSDVFQVSRNCISRIINRETWSHI